MALVRLLVPSSVEWQDGHPAPQVLGSLSAAGDLAPHLGLGTLQGDPPPSVQGDHIPVSSQCFIHRPGDSDDSDPMRQRGGAREVVSVKGGPLSTPSWLASGLQGTIHLHPDLF